MTDPSTTKPLDYLLIGHVTEDINPDGSEKIGGTASFSGLTAMALGNNVGILTSCRPDLSLEPLNGLELYVVPSEVNTTFRNIHTATGRLQYMYQRAAMLDQSNLPESLKQARIVHLGPVASEIDPDIFTQFPKSLICLTPQGWLRGFAEDGRVSAIAWPFSPDLLKAAHATVLSIDDVRGDETQVEQLASLCRLLVVTENQDGARVFWNGDVRRFSAPRVTVLEDTGAGDIFAACFFHRLHETQDPWEAARFAVQLSSASVTRSYYDSIPTPFEIARAKTQIL